MLSLNFFFLGWKNITYESCVRCFSTVSYLCLKLSSKWRQCEWLSLTVIDKRMVMRLSGEELWKVVETIISLAFGANAISLKSQKQERKRKHLSKTLTKQSLSLAKAKASTFMYI